MTEPPTADRGESGSPTRIGPGDVLLLGCVAAGFGAIYLGLETAAERPDVIADRFAVDPWMIRGALMLGGASLLGSLWLHARRKQHRAGIAMTALRVLFEISILGAASYLVYLQPFRKATFDVALGLAFSAWGLVLLTLPAVRRAPAAVRTAELILFNLCFFALLLEGALRLAASTSSSPVLSQADVKSIEILEKRKRRHRPGRLRLGFPLNSLGHYDVEPERPGDGGARIAMIGDSFSFGVVPHHFHFSTVAERRSGIEIDNYGHPGIGPLEYLYLLRHEALSSAPDVVAVNLFVGNDIGGARRFRSRNRALRMWLGRDNLLLYQVPRRLARLRNARLAGATAPATGRPGTRRRLETVEEIIEAYPALADPTLEKPHMTPEQYLDVESESAAKICDPASADASELFAVLREMRRASGATPFAVHLIPDEFQVDDELWKNILERTGNPRLARDLPQQLIGEWLAQEGIPYLDLLPVLRAQCAPRRGNRHCYHLRDTHFNARGNRVAGEAMARFLARLPEPG